MNLSLTLRAKIIAALFAVSFLFSSPLRSDDSQWFAIPENATFEQLHEFYGKLREEFLKRNAVNNERHRANHLTHEDSAVFSKFREQFEKTHDELCTLIEALPEQTKASKEFVYQRKWTKARRGSAPDYQPSLPELKKLLDLCGDDPDLADVRKSAYSDWFGYSIQSASQSELDQLFEQLLTDLRENELQAVYRCDGYFKRLSQVQPENFQKMNANLGKILAILEKSQNEKVKNFIPKIEGSVRFYTLPDQEMELKGISMDGAEFDLASLKGKVVYVDFWAVWCGPCIAEMPELHGRYRALKDAGFEVISYSIDDDFDKLTEFLDKTQYTWKTISVLKSQEKGFRNYYDFYGAAYVPKTVLIGRDGKVIKTDVRGYQLESELNKLFGDEMERKALDPNAPTEFKLRYFLDRLMSHMAQKFSNEMYDGIITFIEHNKDNPSRDMENLTRIFISHLNLQGRIGRGENTLVPEHQPLTVMKRLLPTLQDSKNGWLREYSKALEQMLEKN